MNLSRGCRTSHWRHKLALYPKFPMPGRSRATTGQLQLPMAPRDATRARGKCEARQRQVRRTIKQDTQLQCKRRPCQSDRFATVALSPSQSGEDLAEFSRSHRPFGALRGPGNGGRRRRSASTILEAPCSLQRQQMHTSNHNHKHSNIHIHIRLRLRLCL